MRLVPMQAAGFALCAVLSGGCDDERSKVVEVGWGLQIVDAASREVVINVGVGDSCSAIDRVEATETASQVHIRAWVRDTTPRRNEGCMEACFVKSPTVTLDRPLSDRQIVRSKAPKRCGHLGTTTTVPNSTTAPSA